MPWLWPESPASRRCGNRHPILSPDQWQQEIGTKDIAMTTDNTSRNTRNHFAARRTDQSRFHRVHFPRARQAAGLTSITAATVMITARNIQSTKINQQETCNEVPS
jgi:hypothetical protein